jgi:hypothetical protein
LSAVSIIVNIIILDLGSANALIDHGPQAKTLGWAIAPSILNKGLNAGKYW